MTTTTPSRPRRPDADRASARRAPPGAVRLAAASLLLLAADQPPDPAPKPRVMLMTGLPLVWGEKGPLDTGSRPAAYILLEWTFRFEPVDVLDAETLGRRQLLFLAQPHRLAPAELAALDGWIRAGGRALILTDPMLTWPSELPLGDIRRPPPAGLLAPLLDHWRLALDRPEAPGQVEARWNGARIMMDSPGRLRSSSSDCAVAPGGWTALCRLGRGMVRVVADADMLRDSVWAPDGVDRPIADNPAVVGEWLDSLAGLARPRPRHAREAGVAGWLVPALLLAAAAAGIGLLPRRRRAR